MTCAGHKVGRHREAGLHFTSAQAGRRAGHGRSAPSPAPRSLGAPPGLWCGLRFAERAVCNGPDGMAGRDPAAMDGPRAEQALRARPQVRGRGGAPGAFLPRPASQDRSVGGVRRAVQLVRNDHARRRPAAVSLPAVHRD